MGFRRIGGDRPSGFTLLETMVVVVLVGMMSAIAAPVWSGFWTRQRLNGAREMAYLSMREAQVKAIQQRRIWQVSFRERSGRIQVAVHPDLRQPKPQDWEGLVWETLPEGVMLDQGKTTLLESGGSRVTRFSYLGHVQGQLGRVTFQVPGNSVTKRCVFVSTLLGALRVDEDRSC